MLIGAAVIAALLAVLCQPVAQLRPPIPKIGGSASMLASVVDVGNIPFHGIIGLLQNSLVAIALVQRPQTDGNGITLSSGNLFISQIVFHQKAPVLGQNTRHHKWDRTG